MAQLSGPAGTAALIGELRARGTILTYDPAGQALRVSGHDAPSVAVSRNR